MFDFRNDITIQEDPKSGSIVPSCIVIAIATILNVSFIAIVIKVLFF
jgi:hypothetical protein